MIEYSLEPHTDPELKGKYYAKIHYKGTIDQDTLVKYMHDHYMPHLTPQKIKAVINERDKMIRDLISQGHTVDLGFMKVYMNKNKEIIMEPGENTKQFIKTLEFKKVPSEEEIKNKK